MALFQKFPVVPPIEKDRDNLSDYSEIIQRNFQDLYSDAHRHNIFTQEPKVTDLEIGIPVVVKINNSYYLYIKVDGSTIVKTNLQVV